MIKVMIAIFSVLTVLFIPVAILYAHKDGYSFKFQESSDNVLEDKLRFLNQDQETGGGEESSETDVSIQDMMTLGNLGSPNY